MVRIGLVKGEERLYMKIPMLVVAAGLVVAGLAPAQKLELKLDHLVALAKEHTVIDMDGAQIRAAMAVAPKDAAESMKGKAEGIEVLQIRTFEFENEGAYKDSDVEDIRRQLGAPGWSRIVSVREKKEAVDVYLMLKEGQAGGIAVISAEPKELTIVNIVGRLAARDLQAMVNSTIAYDLSELYKKSQ
jgi:hypothetical protein